MAPLNIDSRAREIQNSDNEVPNAGGDDLVFDSSISNVPERYHGTADDAHDMNMLGKKQVLRRNFNFITMLGFASTCIASWEGILTYLGFALIDGGTPLLFWGFIVCAIGQTLVYASLAEMASMSPTAGGQYHWVSEFAPPRLQKVLSYYAGWLTAIGWQVYLASVCFLVGTIIQGLIALNNPTYGYERWHGTLLAIAVVVFSIVFNTSLASQLPKIELAALALHITGFLAVVITLLAMAPKSSASTALLDFQNNGGWPTTGLSAMIGLLTPQAVLIGYDCSVHMSEEIRDASLTVPRALMASVLLNVTLVFVVIITVCFTIGPDPITLLDGPSGYPFIELFHNATGSLAAASTLATVVAVMLAFCAISEVAACSRQIWSFARDRGLPLSGFLSHVSPRWNIPLRAVAVSLAISALLSLINIGSSVALNAITSLGAVAVLCSYFLTIACLVSRRLRGPELPARRWSLGGFGMAANVAALVFLLPLIFFLTWPLTTPVTAEGMNWSSVMLVGVLVLATLHYVVKARHVYEGPVVLVKRMD